MSKEIEVLQAQINELQHQLSFALMEKENLELQLRGPSALPLGCIGYVTIKLMDDGGLQTSGNIGDPKFALQLLDHAKDAIKANAARSNIAAPTILGPNGQPVVSIPARDVDAQQNIPTHAFGDAPPGQRGDMPPA
jgi:hypothetical protein